MFAFIFFPDTKYVTQPTMSTFDLNLPDFISFVFAVFAKSDTLSYLVYSTGSNEKKLMPWVMYGFNTKTSISFCLDLGI